MKLARFVATVTALAALGMVTLLGVALHALMKTFDEALRR